MAEKLPEIYLYRMKAKEESEWWPTMTMIDKDETGIITTMTHYQSRERIVGLARKVMAHPPAINLDFRGRIPVRDYAYPWFPITRRLSAEDKTKFERAFPEGVIIEWVEKPEIIN